MLWKYPRCTVDQIFFQRLNYREEKHISLRYSGFALANWALTISLGTLFFKKKKKNRVPDCYWGLGSLPESLNSNHCSEQLPEAEVACESPHVTLCTNLEKHTTTLMLNAQCLSLQQSLLKNGLRTSTDVFLCLLVPEANRRCLPVFQGLSCS